MWPIRARTRPAQPAPLPQWAFCGIASLRVPAVAVDERVNLLRMLVEMCFEEVG